MSQIQVPTRWATKRLEDICEDIQPGFAQGKKDVVNGSIHLRMNNIGTNFEINFDLVRTIDATPEQLKKYKLEEDDIIFNNTNSSKLVGKSAIFNNSKACLYSNHLTRIRVKKQLVVPQWLLFYLRIMWLTGNFERMCNKWINQAAVNNNKIKNLEIPLAPLDEQKKIVQKLNYIFTQLEKRNKAIIDSQKVKKISELTKQLRISLLSSACSGDLTIEWRRKNPVVESAIKLLERIQKQRNDQKIHASKRNKITLKNSEISITGINPKINTWADAKLENLIYISGRIGWKGLKREEYTQSGPSFLSVHSLNYGEKVDFRDALHISIERYKESPEIQLQENDILLAKDGAGIGKIGIIKNLDQLATVNSSLLVIRSCEAFIPKYLFYFLSGPELQKVAQERISGSATPHLFQKDIKNFILSVPPLEEQQEIVRIVDEKIKVIDHISKQIESIVKSKIEIKSYVDSLPTKILQHAFSGKLVN